MLRFVQFAGNTIQIECDELEILNALDSHLAHCLSPRGNIVAEYQITTEPVAGPKTGTKYSMKRNGEPFQVHISVDNVLYQLMQDGLTQLNAAASTQLIFHSATLALGGKGILMCGKSGSGKSTLAAWLTIHGYKYLTDEVSTYSAASKKLEGFTRSLILKSGSARIWEGWLVNANPSEYRKMSDDSLWITPTLLNPTGVAEQADPALILFPTYRAGADFRTEHLSTAQASFELMQCFVNARNFPDYGLNIVKELSQKVSSYRIIYSDMEQVDTWIRTVLNT